MNNIIDVFHDNNVKPSIDKISIFGHADKDIIQTDFDAMTFFANYKGVFVRHVSIGAENSFREIWTISYYREWELSQELVSIAILIGFNGKNNCLTCENQRKFKIEFNPNKFVIPDWLLEYFVNFGYRVDYIKNIDVAFDFFKTPKAWFRLFPASGNTKCASIGTSGNKTDYIGFGDKSKNRIKVYDKALERKKYQKFWCDVTRVEITLDYEYRQCSTAYDKDCKSLVQSAAALSQISVSWSDSTDPFVFALSCLEKRDLDAALKMMSVNTRRKYKELLSAVVCRQLQCAWTDLHFFLDDELQKILKSMHMVFAIDWDNIGITL